jgi:alginate O-acetyltransferase complex protein AlgI
LLFNSFSFIVFFIVVLVIYYLPFVKKYQPLFLVIVSIYFYGVSTPKATIILICSIVLNSIISFLVINAKQSKAIVYATIGITLNLVMLMFFKYAKLFTLTFIPHQFIKDPVFQFLLFIPLPIGISFFTFEGISLLVDTLKRKDEKLIPSISFVNHLQNTSLFISFFPHLIAGPILKADHFIPQIGTKIFKNINWEKSFKYLIIGYFFKMVIADNLKEQTSLLVFPFDIYHPITLLSMLFGYSFQIFADFAGYSSIALGLATLLGYDLVKNFDYPYISTTFSEFWTRWHISLSKWLKEYLYIPLGGNRKSSIRTYLNLMIVMLLGGLWHGATWNFAIWGAVHGLALVFERLMRNFIKPINNVWYSTFKITLVFTIVTFAWLFFKLNTFTEIAAFYSALNFANWGDYYMGDKEFYILLYCLPVIFYYAFYLFSVSFKGFKQFKSKIEPVLYGLLLAFIIVNSGFSGSFIYFRF